MLFSTGFETMAKDQSIVDEAKVVKIQTSRSDMKPWLNFNDGATRMTFNTAVHGQALYFTPDLNIKPGYIKSWQWDMKERKYRLKLDTSLRFHDGRAITAKDFEFTLLKPFFTKLPTTNETVTLSFIAGVKKINKGDKFKHGSVEGVKVIDNETIDIYLTSGHTRFLYSLGSLLAAFAPEDSFKEDYYTFKDTPIGAGPYKVEFNDPQSSMVRLKRIRGNGPEYLEFYSSKTAHTNKVDIALGGGIYDMKAYSAENPNTYRMIEGALPNSIQVIVFNYQTEAAQNENFRRAVSLAIERWENLPEFPNLKPTNQIIPSVSFGYNSHFKPVHDIAKAKEIFAKLPQSIKSRTHKLIAHGTPGTPPVSYYVAVRDALRAIGMKVELEVSEETRIADGDTSRTMVLFGRYVESNPLSSFGYYYPGVSNETLKSNPEYAALFDKAENTESIEEVSKLIARLSEEINKKSIVIPLHERRPNYFLSNKISEVGVTDNAWALNVDNIKVKSK
jgi:ABC-type transport system substrate-binding protein